MMFYWILISLTLFCNVLGTGTGYYKCPDGYSLNEMDNTCIKVHVQPRMKYDDAQEVCEKEKTGDLAQPQDIDSNKFIAGLLTKRGRYWIGIKKTTDEDDGVSYANGNPLPFNAPWAWREPNNHRGNERCVEMIANNRGSWNDKRCSKKRPFVCQRHAEMMDGYDLMSCDFESKCHYSTYTPDDVTVVANYTDTVDHTHGTSAGHFLLHSPLTTMMIMRPVINVTEESCLSFFFQGQLGSVSVKIESKTGPVYKQMKQISVLEVSRMRQWNKYSETVQRLQNVMFSFVVQSNEGGNVLAKIDDISLRPGACTPTP